MRTYRRVHSSYVLETTNPVIPLVILPKKLLNPLANRSDSNSSAKSLKRAIPIQRDKFVCSKIQTVERTSLKLQLTMRASARTVTIYVVGTRTQSNSAFRDLAGEKIKTFLCTNKRNSRDPKAYTPRWIPF